MSESNHQPIEGLSDLDGFEQPSSTDRVEPRSEEPESGIETSTGIPRVSAFKFVPNERTEPEPEWIVDGATEPGTRPFGKPAARAATSRPGGDASDDGTEPRRGPGRPKGSTNKAAKTDLVVSLEMLLTGVHKVGASLLDMPDFALQPDEARALSDSIQEVSKHYTFGIDPKTVAISQLSVTLAGIYVPRAVMIWRGASQPKKTPKLVSIDENRKNTAATAPSKPSDKPPSMPVMSPLEAAILAGTMMGESEN